MHPHSFRPACRAGIALGSNLGDRLGHLRRAAEELRQLHADESPVLASRIYQTEPRFCPPDSPPFLNAVVEIAWTGTPEDLHGATLAIESRLGRLPSTTRNMPRVIDVDILYVGDHIVRTESLEIPHPRITERRFVLQPLADIRLDLVLPGQHAGIASHLAALDSDESDPKPYPTPLLAG